MNLTIIAGAVALVLGGLLLAQCQKTDAAYEIVAAKQDEIDKTWRVENKALAAKLELANGEIDNVHAMMDALDSQARTAKETQQQAVLDLARKEQTATDEKAVLFNRYLEALHARPKITIQGVSDGWDPVVLDGMRALKCVQLRAAAGGQGDFPDCRLQGQGDSARTGLAGDPAGTDYPRPTAEQQLEFLSFAWRLRDWGASCYDDKRAIAASSQVTP